ncbi:MAG: hypothetical protein AAFX02_08405 [Pseudomonadota bacterium]
MPDSVEKQSNRRAFLMMFLASTFLIWQVPAMDFLERMSHGTQRLVDIVAVIGGLLWVVALVGLVRFGGRKTGPAETRAALEDELVQANRATAFRVGYFAMLVATTAMFALAMFGDPSPRDVAHIILIAGVVTPMYAFAFLERRNA